MERRDILARLDEDEDTTGEYIVPIIFKFQAPQECVVWSWEGVKWP